MEIKRMLLTHYNPLRWWYPLLNLSRINSIPLLSSFLLLCLMLTHTGLNNEKDRNLML